jgi:DNA-binding LacI/PurR family transcriptional regulator
MKKPQQDSKSKHSRRSKRSMTMDDLARIAGVAKITVSRALRDTGNVNDKTRERIRALAEKHGYRFNVSARNLRLRQSHTIAVIVEMTPSPDRPMFDSYPLELLGGIAQEISMTPYSILLTMRHDTLPPAIQAADALILLGQGVRQEAVHQFSRLHLPMVIWGAPVSRQDYIVVGGDNRQGGIITAERFIGMGRRRPVFIGDIDHPEIAERQAGFIESFKARGITPIVISQKGFTSDAGSEAIAGLLRRKTPFDAVLASSDLLAMGAIRSLMEAGRQIPDDVSVIGYDDMLTSASFIPPLTSVHQNWRDGGTLLARKAIKLLKNETVSSEVLPCHLVVRAT